MPIPPDLLSLNDWARPFAPDLRGAAFEAAREQATQQRLAGPAETWNAWASAMLAVKDRIASDRGSDVEGSQWRALAETSLEGGAVGAFDFSGRLMPSAFQLSNCRFSSHVFFTASRFYGDVQLSRCVFADGVDVASAAFSGQAAISHCRFEGRSDFSFITADAAFSIEASIFERDAWFRSAAFAGAFRLSETRFRSDVGFHHAKFKRAADFAAVLFEDTLGVEKAVFCADVSFQRSFALRRVLDRDVVFETSAARRAFENFVADNVIIENARPSAKVIPFPRRDRRKGA